MALDREDIVYWNRTYNLQVVSYISSTLSSLTVYLLLTLIFSDPMGLSGLLKETCFNCNIWKMKCLLDSMGSSKQ